MQNQRSITHEVLTTRLFLANATDSRPDSLRLSESLHRRGRKVGQKFREVIDEEIGREFGKTMAAKTIRYAADPRAGVARGLHVNFGVTDEHHLRGRGAEFPQNCCDAHRVGLLAFKAIAAIYDLKGFSEAQPLQNPAAPAPRQDRRAA